MQLGQPKNLVEVIQVFLQWQSILGGIWPNGDGEYVIGTLSEQDYDQKVD